jgi:uncharacterized membrane protein YbhN (UPF0104 family)
VTATNPVAGRARAWRIVTSAVVAAGFVALIAANRADARDASAALRAARLPWLACGLVLAALWAVNQAALHAAAQHAVGETTRTRQLAVTALAASFLNLVTKSGGMAGLAVFAAEGSRRSLARGKWWRPTCSSSCSASWRSRSHCWSRW